MSLIELQRLFCRLAAELIQQAITMGYQPRLGEAWRTPEQAQWNAEHGTGIANSLHLERLALDLLLDNADGEWLTKTDDYQPLGEWWEKQHELCCWGGRFSRPDGNHFSLAYQGRA